MFRTPQVMATSRQFACQGIAMSAQISRLLLLALLVLMVSSALWATLPSLVWEKQGVGNCGKAYACAVTPDGGVLITGYFQTSVLFGAGEAHETTLTAVGGSDYYLARFDANGALQWAKSAGSTGNDSGYSTAVLPDGGVLATGCFSDTIRFGIGEAHETTLLTTGSNDYFLACYEADGTLRWVKRIAGAYSVVALPDGGWVVTGFFNGTATYGAGEANQTTLTSSGAGDWDIFLARYNAAGLLQWAKRAGGTGSDCPGHLPAITPDGGILLTGGFQGTAVFGEGDAHATTLTSVGPCNIFLARYDANGSLLWAKSAGGSVRDYGLYAAALPDGGAIITGTFQNTAIFGAGEVHETTLTSAGGGDVFIARYSANGALQWAKGMGGPGADGDQGVTALPDGGALLAGDFQGTAVFGKGEAHETPLTSVGDWDRFFARFDPNGTLQWAIRSGDSNQDEFFAVDLTADGGAIAAGSHGFYFGQYMLYPYLAKYWISPAIGTPTATAITTTTATLGGTITSTNGDAVTAAGVKYATTADLITNPVNVACATFPQTGAFTVPVTGLTPNTTYHYRAYATNGVGTGYAADATFSTLPEVSVDSLTPATGSGGGGTTVTLTGANFGATQGTGFVTFDGMPATISSWSDTQIVCDTPRHAGGAVDVVVTADNGASGTKTGGYTYRSLVSIPMTLAHWVKRDSGDWEETADGIVFHGSGPRHGNGINAKDIFDCTDAEVYLKWKINPNTYKGVSTSLGSQVGPNCTVAGSYASSTALTGNTWYYSRITFVPINRPVSPSRRTIMMSRAAPWCIPVPVRFPVPSGRSRRARISPRTSGITPMARIHP